MADYEFIRFDRNAEDFLMVRQEDDATIPYIRTESEDGKEETIPITTVLSYNETQDMDYDEIQEYLGIPEDRMEEVRDYLADIENLHGAARKLQRSRNYESSAWVKAMKEDIMREFELTKEDEGKIQVGIDNPQSTIRRAYLNIIEREDLEDPNINYEPSDSLVHGDELHLEDEEDTLLAAGYVQDEHRFYLTATDQNVPEIRVSADDKKEMIDRVDEMYSSLVE